MRGRILSGTGQRSEAVTSRSWVGRAVAFSGGWSLLVFALCVRGVVLLIGLSGLQDDPDAYARLARNWSQTGVLGVESADGAVVVPTAFRPPLYPWLLSWLATGDSQIPVYRIAGLHLLLGCGTVWLTWSIARRLGLRWPWLPAVGVAVDPLLLRGSQLVMTETLAACLVVLAWRLWLAVYPAQKNRLHTTVQVARQRGALEWLALVCCGAVLGLSILARPTAGPWVALIALGLLFVYGSDWQRRLLDCALVSLIVAGCLAPWIVRNQLMLGKPIWATSHGGYTLLLANNPMLYEHFGRNGPSRDWNAEPFHQRWGLRFDTGIDLSPRNEAFWLEAVAPSGQQRPFNELADDAAAYAAARATIGRQPEMFGLSSIYRLGWLWAIWPNTGSALSRLAIGGWYASIFALAVVGMLREIRTVGGRVWLQRWWLALSLVVSLSVVHAVYWSNMRMRGPAMAVIYLAAGAALTPSHLRR